MKLFTGLKKIREFEKLQLPFLKSMGDNEDVRGLQIAVDDETRVCKGHGVEDLAEQCKPVINAEYVLIAVARDGYAVDPFHGQKSHAVDRDAGLVKPGDVFMFEACQQVAFARDALARSRGICSVSARLLALRMSTYRLVMRCGR